MTEDEHVLTCLPEEASEIIAECNEIIAACTRVAGRASKALRFGLDEIQPGQDRTNAQRLADELGDLKGVIEELEERGLIPAGAASRKRIKVDRFIEYAIEIGAISE